MQYHVISQIMLTVCTCDHGPQKQSFLNLRSIQLLKTEPISFTLMYDLLQYDNIWLRYNYLKIWNQVLGIAHY